jgi:flagellar M-ring protein FliF
VGQSLRTLPAAHKAILGIAAAVLAMAGFLFVQWVSVPSYSVLASGLTDSSLAEIVNELDRLGYDYQIGGGGSTVLVTKAEVHRARADLATAGVQNGASPEGYELLDNQGLNVSDFRQQIDYQRALEGELAQTLVAMDGVAAATVHLVLPEESLFADEASSPEASVLVTTPRKLTPLEVETITFLLASAVEGLDPSGVTVADVDGEVLHAAGEESMTATTTNRNLRMTNDFEHTLAADVQGLLDVAIGPDLASVVVRADLDFDEFSAESETYTPESAVVIKEFRVDETFTGTGDAASGTVGVDGAPTGDEALDESNYTRSEATSESVIDREVTRTVRAPGRIRSLSVAVVMDNGALTGAAVPTPQEVESLVTAALGLDSERGDSVVVSSVPFPAPVEVAEDTEAAAPAATAGGNDMIPQIVGGAALLVVAVALLLLTRGKPASGQVVSDPTALPAPSRVGGSGAYSAAALSASRAQEDVVGLIEKQPQEVAVLLRSWLADRR